MKKIKMAKGATLTFKEDCDKYLEYCRHRNLREGTIRHYDRYRNILRRSPKCSATPLSNIIKHKASIQPSQSFFS